MFEKCITCHRLGDSCVPNIMLLPFSDLIKWCTKRQKHLEWTSQTLADRSKVPLGTINRIKAGDYMDCKYSTIKALLIALIGGTTDEFPCNEQVDKELQHMAVLEKQNEKLSVLERENEEMKARLATLDEQHRSDIRTVKAEYQEQLADYRERIAFLKDELKAWRTLHQR